MSLYHQRQIDTAHHRGVLRKNINQPNFTEPHQRISDRSLADTVVLSKLGAR